MATFPLEGMEILLTNDKKRIKHGWRYSPSVIKKKLTPPGHCPGVFLLLCMPLCSGFTLTEFCVDGVVGELQGGVACICLRVVVEAGVFDGLHVVPDPACYLCELCGAHLFDCFHDNHCKIQELNVVTCVILLDQPIARSISESCKSRV